MSKDRDRDNNQCVIDIHRAVSKHPVAVVVAYSTKQELKHAMSVYEKSQVPLPAFELHAEGPDDPCLEEIPDIEKFPTLYIYKDGVKVNKVELKGNAEEDAKAFRNAVESSRAQKNKV